MMPIRHSQHKHRKRWHPRRWITLTLFILGVLTAVFIIANSIVAELYRGKVLPNYSIGAVPVGGIPIDQLDRRVTAAQLMPKTVTLTKDKITRRYTTKDLGVMIHWPETWDNVIRARVWPPLLSLVMHHQVSARFTMQGNVFRDLGIQAQFSKAPQPERIVFKDDNFVIAPPENGYMLQMDQLKDQLIATLEKGQDSLQVPVSITAPADSSIQLSAPLAALQKQLDTKITYTYAGKSRPLTRSDIGQFYAPSPVSPGMEPTPDKIKEVLGKIAAELGATPVNLDDAAYAALYAIHKAQPVTFALANKDTKIYHYCTAVKGVSTTLLPQLHEKLAATYGDPRGWNQGGGAFVYSEDGCQLRVWLSAPQSMTGFGSICDNYYSCTVYPSVIINYDRWQGATDPWNAAGGSLEDYRVMVINHESGHWLGFGHRTCPGPGQLAPVMQQQSISLQGCTFNPWPTPAEITTLKSSLGS